MTDEVEGRKSKVEGPERPDGSPSGDLRPSTLDLRPGDDRDDVGTLVLAEASPLAARKRWISRTLKPRGKLTVDEGARAAIAERGKSLLPSGVRAVEGAFQRGEAVSVVDEAGREVARGLSSYDSGDLARIAGKRTDDARAILGFVYEEAIHRDDLVILP